MSLIVYLLTAISAIYGLMWLVFTFVDPPPSLYFYFRAPSVFSFLPSERAGRFAMALVCCGLIPFFATTIVAIFM